MKRLEAIAPITYGAYSYDVGDELPQNEETETWVANGVAVWKEDEQTKAAPKAIPFTAEPGITGLSTTGNPDDLVGKVPKSPLREKDKPKSKRRS